MRLENLTTHSLSSYTHIPSELCLYFLLIFAPVAHGGVQLHAVTIIHLAAIFMFVFWLFHRAIRKDRGFFQTPVHRWILPALGLGAASTVLSPCRFPSVQAFHLLVDYVLVFVVALDLLDRRGAVKRMVWILLATGAWAALYRLFGWPSWDLFHVSKNHFAGYLNVVVFIGLGACFAMAREEAGGAGGRRWPVVLAAAVTVAAATALFLSNSIGGMITIVFISPLFFLMALPERPSLRTLVLGYLAWGAVVALLCYLSQDWVDAGFPDLLRRKKGSALVRLSIWQSTIEIIKNHPLLGSGPGTYRFMVMPYRAPRLDLGLKIFHAHNDYLEAAANFGLLGLAVFVAGGVRFFHWAIVMLGRRRSPFWKSLALGALTAATAILFYGLFDFNLHIPANALWFTVCLALAAAALNVSDRFGQLRYSLRSRKVPGGDRGAFILASGAAVCAVPLIFFHAGTLRAEAYYSQGAEAANAGKLERASEVYEASIAACRGNAKYPYALGNVLHRLWHRSPSDRKLFERAEAAYRRADRLCPGDYNVLVDLGRLLATDWQIEASELCLRRAVELNPNTPFLHLVLGDFYLNYSVDRLDEGLDEYRRAVEVYPRYFCSYAKRALRYTRRYDELKRVVPDQAGLHYKFAQLLIEKRILDGAREELERAIALDPENLVYYELIERILIEMGRPDDVPALWDRARRDLPDHSEILLKWGEALEELGEVHAAEARYRDFIPLDAKSIEGERRLTGLLQRIGRVEEVVGVWEAAVRRVPRDSRVHEELAVAYRLQGRWLDAVKACREAMRRDSGNIVCLNLLSEMYMEKGMDYEAMVLWKKEVRSNPDQIPTHLKLGEIYERMGKRFDAQAQYREVLKRDPMNKDALEGISRLKEKR